MRPIVTIFLFLLTTFWSSEKAVAAELFPETPMVKLQVEFWEKVFRRYKSSSIVIHDPEMVDLIIDVVDYEAFAKKYNNGKPFSRDERKTILNRYIERYQMAINRFQKLGRKALEYGPMEERVLQVYSRRKESLSRLFTEEIYLRTQQGMADEFVRAAERASMYLPYMETIFKNRGMPVDLTRIAFVESMFNKQAMSKVGASGMWQFMPSTARLYMTLNPYIDERLSPLKASYGAAVMLGDNLRLLKEWPLAITAYNHGPGGMRRAVKKVGSKDFDKILREYQHPSFGFASRNFYSEFLAARAVYRDLYQKNISLHKNPMRIDHIRLKHPISIAELIKRTPLNEEILKEYNECLLPQAFRKYRNKALPAGFEIIVPQNLASRTKLALNKIDNERLARNKGRP